MKTIYNFGIVVGLLAGKQEVMEKLGETRKYTERRHGGESFETRSFTDIDVTETSNTLKNGNSYFIIYSRE
jgi:hypothetical protein